MSDVPTKRSRRPRAVVLILITLLGCVLVSLVGGYLGISALRGIRLNLGRNITIERTGEEPITLRSTSEALTVEESDGSNLISVFNQTDGTFLWSSRGARVGADRQHLYVWSASAGQASTLHALRLNNGEEDWRYQDTQGFPGQIQAVSGIVYIGGETALGALDASTGRLVWAYPLGQPVMGWQVVGTIVYLWGTAGIVALRAQDGAVLWQTLLAPFSDWTILIQGGALYVGKDSPATSVTALDASTGQTLWTISNETYPGESGITDLFGIADDVLYVQEANILSAVRTSDGVTLWNHPISTSVPVDPPLQFTFTPSALYSVSDPLLIAISLQDGAEMWERTTDTQTSRNVGVVGVGEGAVYLQTTQELLALSISDGHPVWQIPIQTQSPALLIGARLYVAQATYSGDVPHSYLTPQPAPTCRLTLSLTELDAQTGAQIWQQTHRHACP